MGPVTDKGDETMNRASGRAGRRSQTLKPLKCTMCLFCGSYDGIKSQRWTQSVDASELLPHKKQQHTIHRYQLIDLHQSSSRCDVKIKLPIRRDICPPVTSSLWLCTAHTSARHRRAGRTGTPAGSGGSATPGSAINPGQTVAACRFESTKKVR